MSSLLQTHVKGFFSPKNESRYVSLPVICRYFLRFCLLYSELFQKKTGFFKEQYAGFSVQIQNVTLTKTCLKKKLLYVGHLLCFFTG